MGLTVHFKLTAPPDGTSAQARSLVGAMRRVALRFQRERRVDRVHPIRSDADTLRRFGRDWLIVPVPGQENTSTVIEVLPTEGLLFVVSVGEDCEPLRLGLCRYPQSVSEKLCPGGTGYQPVPSGYQPDGTAAASQANENPVPARVLAAVPVGRLPTGAGRLPAPPEVQTHAQAVAHQGRRLRTWSGPGWRWAGFSKTQYASLHGWDHFQRCHCAVVEMLAAVRSLGLRVRIADEGAYWPRRSLPTLRRNLDEMNGLVAATAGALKDLDENREGRRGVESPIFAHRRFERLEAEGTARVAPVLKKLRAALGDA